MSTAVSHSTRQPLTAAVITRIQLIEAPYLNEFVYWYVDVLGFSRVYAVNTEPWNEEAILQHLDAPIKEKMTLVPLPVKPELQNKVETYMKSLVQKFITQEEYVLHVDSDELMLLPHTASCKADPEETPLRRFLESQKNTDKFVFGWLTIACDSMYCESMVELWRTHPTLTGKLTHVRKSMARVEKITHVDHHNMSLKRGAKTVQVKCNASCDIPNKPIILHFITRSKSHTVWKILYQRMRNHKSTRSSPESIRDILMRDTPPPIASYSPRLLIHMHEVVYGVRDNVLGDPQSRAELVPPCPYKYAEETQKDKFDQLLRDIMGPEHVEKALVNLEKYMNTDIIHEFTVGRMASYATPGNVMTQKFNKVVKK